MNHLLLAVPLLALAIGFVISIGRRARRANESIAPGLRTFFERTGYRYPDMPDAPLSVQAEAAARRYAQTFGAGDGGVIEFVRDMNGALLRHRVTYRRAHRRVSVNATWTLALPRPPRFGWHITERGSGIDAGQVSSGDPHFDARFQCRADHPEVIRHVLAAPGLKQMLLACADVHLRVSEEGVSFIDIEQRNILAAMGGPRGAASLMGDYGAMMEATIPVHARICEMLYVAGVASL